MSGPKLRIGPILAIFMIGTALIYDGIKFLLSFIFMGWLMSVWATMTFWFWFAYLGVSFTKSGKMLGAKVASLSLPSITGLLPVISALPAWTAGVATNIAIVYAEDILNSITPKTLKSMGGALSKIKNKKGQLEKPTTKTERKVTPPVPQGEIVHSKDGQVGRVTQTEYGKHTEWE